MRILITGGLGFIGSALIRELLNHAHLEIMNIDNGAKIEIIFTKYDS